MSKVTKSQVRSLVGKSVYVVRKDRTVVSGKLVAISGNRLMIARPAGKKVKTSAILPLVLFDVLAIGTAPFAYGGGFGGYGGIGGYPYGGGGLGWGGWW